MWAARHGLQLVIAPSGAASWSLRYSTRDGKRRLMKLTEYEPVNAAALAALEAEAAEYRAAIIKGHDPLAERSRSAAFTARRSEEHTSELQSLMRISYAVFCLKKTKK